MGEKANDLIIRIDQLLNNSTIIETSYNIKIRAAQRAIDKKAPFHLKKNSINDAILIEIYADCIKDKSSKGIRFAFVTHNTSDFSLPNGNNKLPHPDITNLFSKIKSLYFINLSEALFRFHPEFVNESLVEELWIEEPRKLTDIIRTIGELIDKVWYNRHMNWLYKIKVGEHKIVENNVAGKYERNTTPRYVYDGARKSAKKLEKHYGRKNLGPWDDFEWGMLNGKLSALRWILGEDWDSLDT